MVERLICNQMVAGSNPVSGISWTTTSKIVRQQKIQANINIPEIIIVSGDDNDKPLSEELAEDIISVIHSSPDKLYGMKYKILKVTNEIKGD